MTRNKDWEQKRRGRQKSGSLPDRKCYLIVTNGHTEEAYFKHYRISTGPIVKIEKRAGIDPRRLVERAIAIRDTLAKQQDFDLQNDETWIVLDRDVNSADGTNKGRFNEALQIAKNSDIMVAYSNDAFELWFVLHYQDLATPTHRTALFALLEKHRGKKYQKGKGVDLYDELKPFRMDAMRRAKKQHERMKNQSPESANPCTTVYVLVEKLMNDPSFKDC